MVKSEAATERSSVKNRTTASASRAKGTMSPFADAFWTAGCLGAAGGAAAIVVMDNLVMGGAADRDAEERVRVGVEIRGRATPRPVGGLPCNLEFLSAPRRGASPIFSPH